MQQIMPGIRFADGVEAACRFIMSVPPNWRIDRVWAAHRGAAA